MRRRRWYDWPRRLLIKARHQASELSGRVRDRRAQHRPMLELERVHRRLELLLAAVYGRSIPIAPLEQKRFNGAGARAAMLRHLKDGAQTASADGDTIFLPPMMAPSDGAAALTRYRLLALEQAERLVRGTTGQSLPKDALERDLYLLREGATIDAHIAQHHRGVADLLQQ